jgi:Ni2+-binding GTPase involved in maturation of urease and hydrogenase
MKTKLVLIGGFLGSGKTTLMKKASEILAAQGKPVGLITNDQAPDLVDTAILTGCGVAVNEVSGSCFCCNFNGFMDAVEHLMRRNAEVILAEPVGSCTDLSATIMQPVKDSYTEISTAPLTVLADPERMKELHGLKPSLMHINALYILGRQLEEADFIILNKADTLTGPETQELIRILEKNYPGKPVRTISGKTGAGVVEWLRFTMDTNPSGTRIAEIDYDRYAEGEAVLGWLNALVDLEPSENAGSCRDYAGKLMERLHTGFKKRGSEIGHVKLLIRSGGKECTANLTRLGGKISITGEPAFNGGKAQLILNARVQMPPSELETLVRDVLDNSGDRHVKTATCALRCLMPGRPDPTHRYTRVI